MRELRPRKKRTQKACPVNGTVAPILLKDNIHKQLLVQITGPNGHPVYFEESLKNFKDANEAGYWKNTQINPDDEFGCIFTGVELTIDSIFGGLEI